MSAKNPSEQYFSTAPSSEAQERELTVDLGSQQFRVRTAAGVFSAHGLDKGTEVLLRKAPELPASGVFVDVGCGWGALSLAMARNRPRAHIYAVDVNPRALRLCAENAALNKLENITVLSEEAALARIPNEAVALIWSNPPVRVGKTALHQILESWRSRLQLDGVAYLVVGKNLGADPLVRHLNETGWRAEKIASSKGFRVLRLQRAS